MTEVRLGVVMDPIADINVKKDSSFAMLLEAQRRGWQIRYMEQSDLFLRDGVSHGRMRSLTVRDEPRHWFGLGEQRREPLDKLDVILMRKDPPFDLQYLYTTHLLELAEQAGVIVVNRPRALRDANEKLYTAWFPQCCPPTLVTRSRSQLKEFLEEHRDLILKPLDAMGGVSVFRLALGDLNSNVIIETLSQFGERLVMAQRFVPEVLTSGDKRILLIDGEPVPYALARLPAPGEVRANLAVGGGGRGVALTARDRWICDQLGQTLRDQGLLFVGLDVIGDYLTEINVTSPTCIRELDTLYGLNISAELLDRVEVKLAARHGS
jgi:glutathione synthase